MISSVIVIMIFNCFSVVSRSKQRELLFFMRSHNVGVVLLNETFLKSRHLVRIDGYKLYRHDAPDNVGALDVPFW